MKDIPSPCVRNCCLDDKDVCLGCHRSMAEIMRWVEASSDEKLLILANAKARAANRQQSRSAKP